MSASTEPTADAGAPLLEFDHVSVLFPVRSGAVGRVIGQVHAVDDVTLTLREGETLGLVGESGCGKTTLARTMVRLTPATEGTLRYRGQDVTAISGKQLRGFRRLSLKPGESATVELPLGPEALRLTNDKLQRVVEPGAFDVMVGTSSEQLTTVKLEVTEK